MGSGSNSAQREAQRAEAERQRRIAATTGQINAAYDAPGRQSQYDDFLKAVRQNYTDDATRQKRDVDRSQKFSLARSGLTGGSAAVDARRASGEEFQRGILQAEDRAQSALGDLKASDEQSRLQLIQMAQSGLDATTAAARANAAISAGAQSALGDAKAKGLGDIFGSTIKTIGAQQEAAAQRRGQVSAVGSLYGNQTWGR
jgi:hypothetical protein